MLKDNLNARIPDLQIVIVGAGIGGLAAAVGLSRAGFANIVIHESTKEIAEASICLPLADAYYLTVV